METRKFRDKNSQVKDPELKKCVLGLDVGMTATRASLFNSRWNEPLAIFHGRLGNEVHYSDNDFPSTCYPLEVHMPPEQCLGLQADARAFPFPLKMHAYLMRMLFLARNNQPRKVQEICDHIPQLNHLWIVVKTRSRDDQDRVVSHMENIFIEHLRQVRKQVDIVSKSDRLTVTQLAVTIPPNWDYALQRIYEKILLQVWPDIARDSIIFVYESEAVGHWLLRTKGENLREMKPERIILADFGGHTLSTYVFDTVFEEEGDSVAFFSTPNFDASCIHGGSELHTALVRGKLKEKILLNEPNLSSDKLTQLITNCMADYRNNLRADLDSSPFFLEGRLGTRKTLSSSYTFEFSSQETSAMFRQCFSAPLEDFSDTLSRLSHRSRNTVVLLSGGTFKNKHIMDLTTRDIERKKLQLFNWADTTTDANRRTGIVSMGAAIAVANSITVEEFLRQSSIVIDECRSDNHDEQPLQVVYHQGKQRRAEIDLDKDGRDCTELYLCCAPLSHGMGSKTIPRSNTYEILLLGRAEAGKLRVWLEYRKMTYKGYPDTDCLIYRRARYGNQHVVRESIWPVFYDPGACVLFIDRDKIDDEELSILSFNKNIVSQEKRHPKRIPRYRRNWEKNQMDAGSRMWEDGVSGPWEQILTRGLLQRRSVAPETNTEYSGAHSGVPGVATVPATRTAAVGLVSTDTHGSVTTSSGGLSRRFVPLNTQPNDGSPNVGPPGICNGTRKGLRFSETFSNPQLTETVPTADQPQTKRRRFRVVDI